MNQPLPRRRFLAQSAQAGFALSTIAVPAFLRAGAAPNARIRIGIMGVNGRGSDLAAGFSALDGAEVAYVCDVDERAIAKGIHAISSKQSTQPKTVEDFRRILDDKEVDALAVAAPDHWHGPATILAVNAGKHVYVEKPVCHNPQEGEWMVAAARKHGRVVQAGTQRRSMPAVVEAIQRVRTGAIGTVRLSRGWYTNKRGSIGKGKPAPVPAWLDYTLWQGPAAERPFRDNLIHYNWHWFWHWGTGELGNNGIHALDLCRWGLGVNCPQHVTAGGGRYHYADDQETPDTLEVTYDFGDKIIIWEGRSCLPRSLEGSSFGAAFYGDQGTLVIEGSSYRIFDAQDHEIAHATGPGDDRPHLQNFLDCVHSGAKPNADIAEGHQSTLLCHLGNIAWRAGGALSLDPQRQRIVGNSKAAALWHREYRAGWQPRV